MKIRILPRTVSTCCLAAAVVLAATALPAQARHVHWSATVVLPGVRITAPGPAVLPLRAVIVPAPPIMRPVVVAQPAAIPLVVARPAPRRTVVVRVTG